MTSLSLLLGRARQQLAQRGDLPKPLRIFVSMSDGQTRAHTVNALGEDLEGAWTGAAQAAQRLADRLKLDVRWLRVDWVTDVWESTFGELETLLSNTKRNYFRHGLALDAQFKQAFLEPELNARALLYPGGNRPQAAVNPQNFAVAMRARFGAAAVLEVDAQTPVWVFAHEGVFLSEDKALSAMPGGKEAALWLPGPSSCGQPWREADCLNAGRRVVDPLDAGAVLSLIDYSAHFLARQVQASGEFTYGHFPCFGRTIPTYNVLRHASSIYAMLEAWELLRTQELLEAIRRALVVLVGSFIRRYPQPDGPALAYNVEANGDIKLGANAVSLLALVKYDELTGDAQYRPLMESLALGIARMQVPQTGGFVHVLNSEDLSVKEQFRIIYYDGEAVFGLMRLYGLTQDRRWLDIVIRAFDQFLGSQYWSHHDHWLSYSANELTLHLPLQKYFEFGVRNVAGYLDFIKNRETTFPTLLELAMAFEAMHHRIEAEHPQMRHVLQELDVAQFKDAMHHRAHYLLNGFFWPELAMFFKNPSSVVGSFFIRHHSFRVRIDDVEHYLSGFVAYWKMLKRQEVTC